jgi:SIT4-associating protein SAP185/190
MSAPAPGPFNPNLGSPGGPDSSAPGGLGPMRNNKFARELVAEDTVERLVGYMLDEPLRTSDQTAANGDVASMAPSTSSLTSSIAVFIELIRKNNSDYSEPHLFHTLRQGLMQHSSSRPPLTECEAAETVTNGEDRESNDQKDMEDAMESLNQGMGIVHLGSMLTVLSARLGSFQELIERPRSDVSQGLPFLS